MSFFIMYLTLSLLIIVFILILTIIHMMIFILIIHILSQIMSKVNPSKYQIMNKGLSILAYHELKCFENVNQLVNVFYFKLHLLKIL